MCLFSSAWHVKKILNRKTKSGANFYYKVVLVCKKSKVVSGPYQRHYVYKPGVNRSDSKQRRPALEDGVRINEGIHVLKTMKDAKWLAQFRNSAAIGSYVTCKVIRVYAYQCDLLGSDNSDAVFKKIYIPAKAYKRLLTD